MPPETVSVAIDIVTDPKWLKRAPSLELVGPDMIARDSSSGGKFVTGRFQTFATQSGTSRHDAESLFD